METSAIIRLSDLIVDPSLQPRMDGIDPDHVKALEEVVDTMPPVVVVRPGDSHLLVDGFHRACAAQNRGLEVISARVVQVPPDGDLHSLAFQLNASHGRPLTLADRRAFSERLLRTHPELADREVARRCGLSSNTVGAIRECLERSAQIPQMEERIGGRGYTYQVGTNERQRQPGELPPVGLGFTLGQMITSKERRQQRRLTQYLQLLSVALEDQYELEGWETSKQAAEACRLVLGDQPAAELAEPLGSGAYNVLQVAIALGYKLNEGTK